MAAILILDDRPGTSLLTLLGFTSHRLLRAADGAQALELVRAERPDLIITDILMPAMDGHEFVQRLRAGPEPAATRVIFYSAIYAERETIAMAASCGVRTVLGKPADPQAIFDAVDAELGFEGTDAPRVITPALNAWAGNPPTLPDASQVGWAAVPPTRSSAADMVALSPLPAPAGRPSATGMAAPPRLS